MELGRSADHLLEDMLPVTLMLAALAAAAGGRAPAVIIAALRADAGCFSTISVENLSGRGLAAEIQARLDTGALVPLELIEEAGATQPRGGPRGAPRGDPRDDPAGALAESTSNWARQEDFRFAPHQRRSFRLGGRHEGGDAWVGVWEADPPGTLPALTVEGFVECVAGDQLRTVPRFAALAMESVVCRGSGRFRRRDDGGG